MTKIGEFRASGASLFGNRFFALEQNSLVVYEAQGLQLRQMQQFNLEMRCNHIFIENGKIIVGDDITMIQLDFLHKDHEKDHQIVNVVNDKAFSYKCRLADIEKIVSNFCGSKFLGIDKSTFQTKLLRSFSYSK